MADDTTQVIPGTSYKTIATNYAKLMYRLTTASVYLLNAVDVILDTDELIPTVDLLDEFYNTYLINAGSVSNNAPFLQAVRKLNSHIIGRGGYADINAFMAANSSAYPVPQSWIDLNTAVGQTINAGLYGTINSF